MTRRWQSCSLSKRRKRQREPSDPHQKAAAQHRGACGVIDPTLTLDDVAKIIHKSRRWLREWLRDNPRDAYDRPLYVMAGRTMLFTDQHVKRILESLPKDAKGRIVTDWLRPDDANAIIVAADQISTNGERAAINFDANQTPPPPLTVCDQANVDWNFAAPG